MLRWPHQARARQAAADLLDGDTPLDEHEQQAVIHQLQAQQLAQNRQFRAVFGFGAVGAALFFAWACWQQHVAPWQQRFTGELRTVTGRHTVSAVLLLQALSMAWAAAALLGGMPAPGDRQRGCAAAPVHTQAQLTASVACACTGAWYWGHALLANVHLHGYALGAHWELLWLPLGPLAYSCACVYVLLLLNSTGRELRQLQRMAYELKTV